MSIVKGPLLKCRGALAILQLLLACDLGSFLGGLGCRVGG